MCVLTAAPRPCVAILIAVMIVAGARIAAAGPPPGCPLAPATIVAPFRFANNPAELRWEPVRGASFYIVFIVNAATKAVAVGPAFTNETSYVAGLQPGPYATIVYAYSPVCGASASKPTLFLVDQRFWHEGALLQDGRVVVAGGIGAGSGPGYLASAQVFDPSSRAWSPAGFMSVARFSFTLTALPGGRVLAAGGSPSSDPMVAPTTASADTFLPPANQWIPIAPMTEARQGHTATLLADGRVLVTGGLTTTVFPSVALASAEIFDPNTGTWTPTAPMSATRVYHTATLLANGMVLVAGGEFVGGTHASAEIYDPASDSWFQAGSMAAQRRFHTAVRLHDGRVLVVAGMGAHDVLPTTELFDPATNTWSFGGFLTGGMKLTNHATAALQDGRTLVIGGSALDSPASVSVPWVHVYDPATSTWSFGPPLHVQRELHTATVLPDGRVVVAGGHSTSGTPRSVEIFDPLATAWISVEDPWTITP